MTSDVTLLLTRGAPGSGKTTWAKSWVNDDPHWRVRVNRDDLRFATYGEYVLDRMREDNITLLQHAAVETALKAGLSVVVDDTNLRAATVRDYYKIADKFGVTVEFADFDTDVETCVDRNMARAEAGGRNVPEEVIRGFFKRYYKRDGSLPDVPERLDTGEAVRVPYEADTSLRKVVLVDIDGTVARFVSRGPFDWTRVHEDEVIENVADVVRHLAKAGMKIVFLSGRDSECRQSTINWLQEKVFLDTEDTFPRTKIEIYMRAQGDMRPDDIVKYELFNNHIRDNYNVVGVIDDRLRVARLWEQIGLTLFRVGPIDADF